MCKLGGIKKGKREEGEGKAAFPGRVVGKDERGAAHRDQGIHRALRQPSSLHLCRRLAAHPSPANHSLRQAGVVEEAPPCLDLSYYSFCKRLILVRQMVSTPPPVFARTHPRQQTN